MNNNMNFHVDFPGKTNNKIFEKSKTHHYEPILPIFDQIWIFQDYQFLSVFFQFWLVIIAQY